MKVLYHNILITNDNYFYSTNRLFYVWRLNLQQKKIALISESYFVFHDSGYKTNPAIKNPKVTANVIAMTPGIKNGWLKTYLPIRVEPVSSISTAAINVG